jgi:hypothetical protein
MPRRYLQRSLIFLWLAALLAVPLAVADDAISPAEQRVFTDPHLDNLPATATLHYRYRKNEAGQAAVDDDVLLSTLQDVEHGRVARVDFLHGERHLLLPETEQAVSNPLVLYFLESDVRGMHRRLGGQENYFRRRIRLALADHAQLREVSFKYAGQVVHGQQVTVQPFADDPLVERFQGTARKAYVFTVSAQVPGSIYELRTRVDNPVGGGAPLLEEILTLREP